jgi:hypothetical protein
MKRNSLYKIGIAALLFALAACANPVVPEPSGVTIPAGMGLARIRLGGGSPERTAVPDIGQYFFTLRFTASGKADVERPLTGGATLTVPLEPAVWTLNVKGYTGSGTDPLTLRVTGSTTVPITAEVVSDVTVGLIPAGFNSSGTGSLNYHIGFPASAQAFFGLYPLDAPVFVEEWSIPPNAAGTLSVPEGSYWAIIELYDRVNNRAAGWAGAVHIYAGLSTSLTRHFNAGDFTACPSPVIANTNTLTAKLDAALNSPDAACTIGLNNETDLASFSPYSLNASAASKTIIIRGNGKTVQLGSNGSLFTIDSGIKLVLYDLTLRGKSSNNAPVVQVNTGGTLEMKTGSLITGNTQGGSSGGGVLVSGGIFTMSGGEVRGNKNTDYGGGGGGGVSISSSGGSFTMNGGAVRSNQSTYFGGGVSVSGGTFTMSAGMVSGNTIGSPEFACGGGVLVSGGVFIMSGGAVGGNILNTTLLGKEVVVKDSGTFILSANARPERIFLYDTSRYITISGPLSGGIVPIDLGDISGLPVPWENTQILRVDSSYPGGNSAALKAYFTLGNSVTTDWSSNTETPIPTGPGGYTINDDGYFVAE